MQAKSFTYLAALALTVIIGLPGAASADTVLNFDDVQGGIVNYMALPLSTNYGGLTWSSASPSGYWGVIDNTSYRNYPYSPNSYDFPTNPNVVINEDGHVGAAQTAVSSATRFNFDGAWFGAWTAHDTQNYYGATSLTLTGKLGDTVVGTTTFALAPGLLAWQGVNFTGIDTLIFEAAGGAGRYFLMDGFTYNPVSSAPLPSTVLLLGSGIIGLALLRRRKKCRA
ncbi:MAG: VPLPA-CTERM sorting domain-containing protein [Desulfobaccales bacterium]